MLSGNMQKSSLSETIDKQPHSHIRSPAMFSYSSRLLFALCSLLGLSASGSVSTMSPAETYVSENAREDFLRKPPEERCQDYRYVLKACDSTSPSPDVKPICTDKDQIDEIRREYEKCKSWKLE
jgi:hypothetical protein